MNTRFQLSMQGRVSAVVTLAFALADPVLCAEIEVAEGSSTQVARSATGVAVIAIAAPSAAGLSHNHFKEYSISAAGAVLNNAVAGGRSQLAGELAGNGSLGGRAAAVILNEVVGRNPSLLLGRQEVFGQAADYVLANPNGIQCQGCGFINTPRATLLVGRPEVEGGRLLKLTTGAEGTLTVRDALTTEGALDLVAPRVDAQGRIEAGDRIDGLSGQLEVGYEDGLAKGRGELDSVYLGGMKAGRVRLAGFGGIHVGADIAATEAIAVDSSAALELEAATLAAPDIRLTGRTVQLGGHVDESTSRNDTHEESWFIWQTGARDKGSYSHGQTVSGTRLDGGHVTLAARDKVALTASSVHAHDVSIAANEVELGARLATTLTGNYDNAWKDSWLRHSLDETESSVAHGVDIEAGATLSMSAGSGGMRISGAKLRSGGGLDLASGSDLRVDGVRESRSQRQSGRRVNEGAGLETGSWNRSETEERIVGSVLSGGGGARLTAANDVNLDGAVLVTGGDLVVGAGRDLIVSAAEAVSQRSSRDDNTLWGGIAGGGTHADSGDASSLSASEIGANGRLGMAAGRNIHISGSAVLGREDAVAAAGGDVVIDNGIESTQTRVRESRGGVFSIPTASRDDSRSEERAIGSEVRAESNLRIGSQGDFALIGSRVDAGGWLAIDAGGKVEIRAASQESQAHSHTSALELGVFSGMEGDKQYRAGWQAEYRRDTQDMERVDTLAASVRGGDVTIRASGSVKLEGSQIAAGGDIAVTATDVDLAASRDTVQQRTTASALAGGAYVSGGIDRAGDGVFLGQRTTTHASEANNAQVSSMDAGNALTLDGSKVQSEGARLNAAGALHISAEDIAQRAASSQRDTRDGELKWGAELGPSADYGEVLRPVVKLAGDLPLVQPDAGSVGKALASAAQSAARGDWKGAYQAGISLLGDPGDAKVAAALGEAARHAADGDWKAAYAAISGIGIPDAGFTLTVRANASNSHDSRLQAEPTQLHGASVTVEATGRLLDQGTQYKAEAGSVALSAGRHVSDVAVSESRHEESADRGEAGLRVATRTGYDLQVKGQGEGEGQKDTSLVRHEQGGTIAGNAIDIRVAGDATYSGTRIEAGAGGIAIDVGGTLSLAAAHERQQETHDRTHGEGRLGLALGETGDSGSGQAAAGGAHRQASATTVQAVGLNSPGAVNVAAGGDLLLDGSRIGARDAEAGPVTLAAGGRVEIDAARGQTQSETLEWSGRSAVAAGGEAVEVEGAGTVGRKHDAGTTVQAAVIVSREGVAVSAGAEGADALRVEGAMLTGSGVELRSAGAMTLESATGTSSGSELRVEATLAGKRKSPTAEAKASLGADVDLRVEQGEHGGLHQLGTRVEGGHVILASSGAVLSGAEVVAGTVDMHIDGALHLQGRPDSADSGKGSLAASLQGGVPGGGVSFERMHDDTVVAATGVMARGDVKLDASGGIDIVGARVESSGGKVEAEGAQLSRLPGRHSSLSGSVDFSGEKAPSYAHRDEDASVAGTLVGVQR
ncbi:hemagglutinin repeat-containing protein [Paludibacterium yongneupense]|uniref:hemagglutinin repeat-containing protein n=1 Tax=Paludibacterium yongneupense TaxID=400061 RepID=UPI00042147B1|nr:hemagglutinin repeat-containing protein [Paludibacterium yongneupense]